MNAVLAFYNRQYGYRKYFLAVRLKIIFNVWKIKNFYVQLSIVSKTSFKRKTLLTPSADRTSFVSFFLSPPFFLVNWNAIAFVGKQNN